MTEYELQSVPPAGPPCFLFVIDTCVSQKEELAELADSLQQALNLLPPECRVGLITFGTNVSVYELASESIAKAYIIRGNREYSPSRVGELLGCVQHRSGSGAPAMPSGAAPAPSQAPAAAGPGAEVRERFLLPVSE